MSQIYLNKVIDFSSITHKNYEHLYKLKKNIDIEKIKKNITLNENEIFNKYNYCEIYDISKYHYSETVLLYPLWYNGNINEQIINALLFIIDSDYLNISNVLKKIKINEKKNIPLSKLSDNFCVNIILISDNINVFSQNYENTIVLIKKDDYLFPVLNFSQKYFKHDSDFIKEILKNKNTNKISIDKYFTQTNNPIQENSNIFYEEIESSEQNPIYLSEHQKNNDKSIICQTNKNKNNIFIPTKINENSFSSSVFKKTDNVVFEQSDIDKLKITSTLSELQSFATKLNICITNGSTKTGKPKNKTKTELFNDIKNYKN
jgi:hypothetical protein